MQNDKEGNGDGADKNNSAATNLTSLRVEPATLSHSETVTGSDGTMYITSFEDAEDVTIEVVLEESA